MKILVTGGNGQLGNELKDIAGDYKYEFEFIDQEELNLINIDSIEPFLNNVNPNIIINCAAYTQVDKAEADQELAVKINQVAPQALAVYCHYNNVRLIHISTDYVFDGKFYQPISEESPTKPLSVYGDSKLKGEQGILESAPDSYIIRTSWLYSRFGNNFVKTMIRLANERNEISVVSDQIGTPTHAKDLAKVLMTIVENLGKEKDNPGVYHYSNEGVCSWYDFAIEIFRQKNIDCKVNAIPSSLFPTKAKRPFFSVLDKTKIKSQFSIEINHWTRSLSDYFRQ